MWSPGFESVVPGEERGGRPVRRGSMHESQGPLHGILRDRSDLSRSPSRPQSRGSNPSTLDHVDPEMADRVNQIYRMLPRILDPISRSHIQSQLEAILDMQQQFPDHEDSFFEKLDVIYRNALDLVKTSPVEKNDIPSVSPANALESSIAASNTGWRMLRAVVIWHVFFVAAQSIFPDLSKHISTTDSPFIKSIADIFSGGWYIVYGGSSYLLALLPCLLAIALHSFRFSIFALICVCIGAAAHVVVPILAVSLYPLDSMTTSNIAAFIVYFAEVIPYALEITSFAMIIHTWSTVEEGFLPARSIPEKASAQSSPSKHKPEVLDSNVHDPEKVEDVSQVPPNMLIENDRSASRTPLSMGSDGFEDSIEDEHERPRSRSSEPRTPDRRATMSRSQSPHPPIPQSEPTSRDGSLRSRLSGSSFDGRRTDESASYRRRKAYA